MRRRGVTVLAVVVLVAGAVVALRSNDGDSPSAASPDAAELSPLSEPRFLSPADQNATAFVLAGNSRGDAAVVWSEATGAGDVRLWVRDRRRGGSFGRPQSVTGPSVPVRGWQAAVGEDGTELVAWLAAQENGSVLQVAVRRPDGSFTQPSPVARLAYDPAGWDIAVGPDGTAIVAWLTGFAAAGNRLVVAERRRGGSWGRQQVVARARGGARLPGLAFDGAGGAVLVWEKGPREYPDSAAAPVRQEVWTAERPAGGAFGAPRLVSDPARDARDPALALNRRGDAALVWNSTRGRNLPGSRIELATRRAGDEFGSPRALTPPGEARLPKVAVGPGGGLTAIWTSDRRKKNGYWCDCPVLVGAEGTIGGDVGAPRALFGRGRLLNWATEASHGGGMLAVWQFAGPQPGKGDDGVRARYLGPDGSLSQVRFLSGRGDHDDPQALVARDGTALVTWKRSRGEHDRVQAMRVRVRPK